MNDLTDEEMMVDSQRKATELLLANKNNDIKQVMSTPSGRRVIWSQLVPAGIFSSTFSVDPYTTAFNEGQRNAGLRLFNLVMRACPDLYLKMASEAEEVKNNESD